MTKKGRDGRWAGAQDEQFSAPARAGLRCHSLLSGARPGSVGVRLVLPLHSGAPGAKLLLLVTPDQLKKGFWFGVQLLVEREDTRKIALYQATLLPGDEALDWVCGCNHKNPLCLLARGCFQPSVPQANPQREVDLCDREPIDEIKVTARGAIKGDRERVGDVVLKAPA